MAETVREIVLDTETTGFKPSEGHRLVEIGCIELINHVATGGKFHVYINPMRPVPPEASAVHGLTDENRISSELGAHSASLGRAAKTANVECRTLTPVQGPATESRINHPRVLTRRNGARLRSMAVQCLAL